jgi:hypothetical protein
LHLEEVTGYAMRLRIANYPRYSLQLRGLEEIRWNIANSVKIVRPEFDQVDDDHGI